MHPFRTLRFALSLAALSSLLVATACSVSGDGASCDGPRPTCAVTVCGGPPGETNASCTDGEWECPAVEPASCPSQGDDGGPYACDSDLALYCGTCDGVPIEQECGASGWTCPPVAPSCGEYDGGTGCPDVEPLCGSCDDAGSVLPTCSGSEWICPVFNCPVEPVDGSDDGGGHDGGADAAPDSGFDAGGDLCVEGASCSEGMSCTIGTAGQLPFSCECIAGQYACTP
jgi:hypothetical protein